MSTRRKGPPRNGTVLHPMDKGSRGEIAMTFYGALIALAHTIGSSTFNEVTRQLAILTAAIDTCSSIRIGMRTDDDSKALIAALAVVEAMDARNDAGEGWTLPPDELATLHECAARLDEALSRVSFAAYEEARNFVDTALARAAGAAA